VIFTNLKMTGFKSFAEPEQISIDDGMTGVVGPNGCGKSNIVESLRWLMGESSARSMRGDELEDIIFAGSASRPSRNFAEVTLSLDNSSRTAPAALNDGDDIEVTRRIERGKGSSFKINGKACRGRDVQLLFADMATGSRSSGIVSQGKVGALINAKPTERRNLLEEAANIRGLHQRRHEAELRLNTAENNLERLDDIVIQLDEQKASLMKQARQAARYRSIADRIRKADAHLMLARITLATSRLNDTEAQLREAERLTAAAAEDASAKSRHHDSIADTLPPLRQDEAALAAELQHLTHARTALDDEEERLKKAADEAAARRGQIDTDFAREKQLLDDADRAIAALNDERTSITADANDDSKSEAAIAALNDARTKAATAEQAQAEAAARHAATEQEAEALAQRSTETQSRLDHARTALSQLNLTAAEEAAAAAAKTRLEAEKNTALIKTKRADHDKHLNAARQAASDAQSAQRPPRENVTRTTAKIETLTALLSGQDGQNTPPVSAAITISGGMEAALAAVLGDALTAPVGDHDNAFWQNRKSTPLTPPSGMTPLADYLELPEALMAAISGIGVAENAAAAIKAQPQLTPGQAITTAAGGLWRWDGFVEPLGAETAAAQRLKHEAELRDLTAKIDDQQRAVANADANADAAMATLAERENESRTFHEAEREADQKLSTAIRGDDAAKAAYAAAQHRHDELTGTLADLEAAAKEAAALSAKRNNPEALRLEVERLTHQAESCREALAEAMSNERAVRTAKEARDSRMDAIDKDMSIWQNRKNGAHSRLDELASRQAQAERDIAQLARLPDDITSRRRQLGEAIDKAEQNRRHAADKLTEAETMLNLAQNAQRQAEQNLAQQRENSIRAESSRDLAQQDYNGITNRINERLNIAPDELREPDKLRELAGINPDDTIDTDDDTMTALESRHERLLRERENIGPVNLRVEEELEEIEERVASIRTEHEDLTAAIKKLRSGISQLNREGRERLLKSFADVNTYFEKLFKILFNGGSAELSLTETDDPLEAGLEILASPPGKKLQTLSLLSGGEQALTALALIFAVFLTNPSPICILDEVDAPLDDTNVARFCDMLAQIADKTNTRFIVVTHHRLTMARMDRLYGVTMEQKGISRIVSVDLQTAEKYKETA
jgi:chromosome segregation protein